VRGHRGGIRDHRVEVRGQEGEIRIHIESEIIGVGSGVRDQRKENGILLFTRNSNLPSGNICPACFRKGCGSRIGLSNSVIIDL